LTAFRATFLSFCPEYRGNARARRCHHDAVDGQLAPIVVSAPGFLKIVSDSTWVEARPWRRYDGRREAGVHCSRSRG
jgi:hypothetical protein